MIKKVLIANRNEIALRIIATCKANNINTVTIYTEEDVLSMHATDSDESYKLSQNGIPGYMNQDEIISIAKKSGANAIHPGYGFLSENPTFAKKVIDAGLIWIGPSPKNIEIMGDKMVARTTMDRLGVPIIPGYHCHDISDQSKESAKKFANDHYPVILKAAMGGGGKAMRKINNDDEFDSSWTSVISEAKNIFGSTEIFIEKYITNGRHIEIQIAADGTNAIHLYERECSIQRRNQKVIEEAPCKFVSRGLLQNMYSVSVSAAKKLGYDSIGTIEFIVTPRGEFYFLEMNTRLQVEHPVTEYITGLDLVWLQLQIASDGLPLTQADISSRGHSIECRILAEDEKFMPSTGKIDNLVLPNLPYIRHDHTLEVGYEVSPYFDPMLSKLISYGHNREQAKNNMLYALNNFAIAGVDSNINLLEKIIETDEFTSGAFHTQWLESKELPKLDESYKTAAIVAATLHKKPNVKAKTSSSGWKELSWR